jgi:hypothetical protein
MRDLYDVHVASELPVELQEIEYIWKHTADKSALRRWVLDYVSLNWKEHCKWYAQSTRTWLFRDTPHFGNSLLHRLGAENAKLDVENYLEETEKTAYDEPDAKRQREAII